MSQLFCHRLKSPAHRNAVQIAEIARLYFQKGMNLDEVAAHLDMTPLSVKKHLQDVIDNYSAMGQPTEPVIPEQYFGFPTFTLVDLAGDIRQTEREIKENRVLLTTLTNGDRLPKHR